MGQALRTIAAIALVLFGGAAHLAAAAEDDRVLVLTALPAVNSVSAALAEGTSIEVRNVPDNGRPLAAQASYFAAQAERLAPLFAAADAVVTIGKLWLADPLYTAARAANIRVVDIDATKPWSTTLEGVGVVLAPQDDAPWSEATAGTERSPSLYFWLSLSNAARMAEIVAHDFAALAPADAERIETNLRSYRRVLLDLKREHEVRLAELADTTVYALTADLVYLTTDLGVYVDGYFLKQDVHWTQADGERLTAHLRANDVRVVIHRWEPAEPIQAAIAAAGARLAVLDPGDAGIVEDARLAPDGYLRQVRANLETLTRSLREAY